MQVERAKLLKPKLAQVQTTQLQWQQRYQQVLRMGGDYDWQVTVPATLETLCHSCLWTTAQAMAIANWLSTLHWKQNPTPEDQAEGTSWYELTSAYLTITEHSVAVNQGGTGRAFFPTMFRPDDPMIKFSQMISAFQATSVQLEMLTQQIWIPGQRKTVTSLAHLGARPSQGITSKVTYPSRALICQHLSEFFLQQRADKITTRDKWPGYATPTPPAVHLGHATDDQDMQLGWHVRFQRYTQTRKKLKSLRNRRLT